MKRVIVAANKAFYGGKHLLQSGFILKDKDITLQDSDSSCLELCFGDLGYDHEGEKDFSHLIVLKAQRARSCSLY
ncbi:hypothetical protein TNCV_767701 [Trichonephila clavipes]|nr:hypothetical protein TNCV_767701 [Trichonephila clavipes]